MMKSILLYIKEALKSDEQKWLNDVYKTNQTLVKDNKITPIEIDVKNLNKPVKPFEYDKFINDPVFKKIIEDNFVGFTVTNQLIKNANKYLKDNDKELKPNCYPYWYSTQIDKNTQNVFFVGLCLYDKNVTYIDNYLHLISIESSLIVKDSAILNKAILNDFIKVMQKVNKYSGISAKPTHPKMKAILLKLGFKISKDNKELLTYKI